MRAGNARNAPLPLAGPRPAMSHVEPADWPTQANTLRMTNDASDVPVDVDEAPAPDSQEFQEESNTVEKVSPDTTADAPATDATLISTDPTLSDDDS